ncbi:PDZ and LIM domain protein Zasp [Diachasma alloeum]|nr:PDZ and LIM domain protein Zasp [Diachasma alloeum]
MAQLISVKLSRFDGSPWGFRLQGGKDFGTPLIVQKVNNGSPAEAAGLRAGDAVIKVNNTEMFSLRHKDAQDVIVRAGNSFEVTVQRGGSTWRPSVSPVTPSIPSPQPHMPVGNISPVTKTSLAAKKPEGPLIGSGHNFSPKPFLNGSSDAGAIKSIVNKQYNSPVGIYSEQTIAETLSAQAEVLAGGVLGVNFKKNEKNYNAQNSEVFKMVQEADKEPRSPEPVPSRTEFYSSVSKAIGGHATSPRSPTPIGRAMGYSHPALSIASSHRDDGHSNDEQLRLEQSSRASSTSDKRETYETTFCHGCDCRIVGVFVRIKEKNLHVECFKCSTCGTSLKNVGYYNINNKLYCDIHAKLVARQQAPAGYVPITVPPGGKAPAGTISAALGNLTCPKSPPLNNGTTVAPALSTICRPTSDHGKPARSYYRPSEFTPTNGHANGCIEKDIFDEKTFTSTITIRTGSEVVSKEECPDNNRIKTNKRPTVTSKIPALRIEENKSPPLVFDPVINDGKSEKAVVGTYAIPRYPITNNPTKSRVQITTVKRQNDVKKPENPTSRDKTDFSKTDMDPMDYNTYLTNHKQKFSQVISAMINGEDNNNRTMSKYTNNDTRLKNEINHSFPINFHTSSSSLATFLLAHRTTHPETLPASPTTPPDSSSSSISSSPIPPITTRTNHFGIPPIDTPSFHPVQTPSSNIGGPKPFSGSRVAPPNFSSPPVSNSAVNNFNRPQSQTVTGRYSGLPKGFPLRGFIDFKLYRLSHSLLTKYLYFSLFTRTNCLNQSQILMRPQKIDLCSCDLHSLHTRQLIPSSPHSFEKQNKQPNKKPHQSPSKESYSECNYYEEVIEEPRSRQEEHSRPPSSVKGKTLNWPPAKSLEDVTYPTASPIWIDPNPVLHRQPRQNVREKRVCLQEACCRSQSVSRNEDCEYERELACWGEDNMDKANSNAPFYRKTESCMETRRECRASSLPRPESAEGSRRSLTPTRINQPTPKPWTATVSSGAYSHVEAPQVPDPPVCKVCTCRIVCEKTSGPSGAEHEQEHHYHKVVCDLCKPPTPEPEPQPICLYEQEAEEVQEVVEETENETIDLSKLVPEDVAICPKGVESQHNMYTETMEKDEGNLHIKKTTIYEKTVEVVTPERGMSPAPDSDAGRQSATSMADREVAGFSGRQECVQAASVITSAINTNRQLDELRKQEDERRRIYEEECRREEERIRREAEEEKCREENRLRILREEKEAKARRIEESRKQTEKCCRLEEEERKHVSFSEKSRHEDVQQPIKSWQEQQYMREERNDADSSMRSQECYRSVKKQVQVQDSYNQIEEEQRQCLREQVEIHKSLRQQQPISERQPSLQERRLQKRFRPQSAEEMAALQEPVCQRKHVQFVTDSDAGIRQLPQSTVKNTTPKEYKTPMCDALTTAPARSYSPFHPGVGKTEELKHYSTEIRYQEISHQAPPPQQEYYKGPYERPVSPFTDALIIAPDRPYTPLGEEVKGVFPVDKPDAARPYTPINQQQEGYCHPAEILYTDSSTRQSRTRERSLRKVEGPRPLPTPPPDYRLRDSSISPARSLSRPTTPAECKVRSGGLKKPDTIPFYQKHLVAVEQEAVASTPYVPSRSPTPHRKSPAPGPPDPPAYYTRAQAPRIRDPPQQSCQRSAQQLPPYSGPYEKVSYHMEEDTPQGHRSSDFVGTRSSYHQESSGNESYSCQYQRREEEKRVEKTSCQEKRIEERRCYQETSEDEGETCGISKISRTQPSLPCPISHSAISDRIQRTGVKVLPTPAVNTSSQISETRRICHQERNTSSYSSQKQESTCANTGVTVLPCRAITDTGASRAGVVIVPCEGAETSQTCPRAGICVTPTPDRSGLCVSPALHGRSAAKCTGEKGIRSGGSEIDIGNCPASGVRVGTCTDGSVCVAPCKVPGFAPVSCPKPAQKPKCPLSKPVPFPHIPLPDEPQVEPCDVCPLKKQQESFPPIKQQQQQQPRTTLSQQLTCMTVKRDKQVVHLFKSQAEASEQCDDGLHCEPREPQKNSCSDGLHCEPRKNSCSDGLHCEPRKNTCSDGKHCEPETYRPEPTLSRAPYAPQPFSKTQNLVDPPNLSSQPDLGSGVGGIGPQGRKFAGSSAPKRGKGILNQAATGRQPVCGHCQAYVRGPFITALGQIWCPEHFVCVNSQCRRHLQDIGFVEEKGQLYCEYCFERFIAPSCNKCNNKIKGDCLNAIGKHYHPECFNCTYCGKLFGNSPFFLEEGLPYCEADWNELFTTKCYACGFPVEAGDRWVEALNNNYHSQCFNCTMCKKNLEGQSFYAKGGRPFCKNHAR